MIATYYTNQRKVYITNAKGEILLSTIFPSAGTSFTLPYEVIKTPNKLELIGLKKPDWSLLGVFLENMKPDRKRAFGNLRINKSRSETKKACIYTGMQQIFYNPEFYEGLDSRVEKKIMLFHEMGHMFYTKESKCDLFAAVILYILGYPRIMILNALKNTLSGGMANEKRIDNLFKFLEAAKR